jgi:mono/diheme cytochrome c family protein
MLAAGALMVAASASTQAQAARTVQDGIYSAAQAGRGQSLYSQRCATCHGAALNGAQGPPLVGDAFVGNWRSEPLSALVDKIHNTMPADAPGELTPQQSVDLVAFILKSGGFPSGTTELAAANTAAASIRWPAAPAAASTRPAVAAAAKTYPPVGTVAQLMRGIFFPNSNLIFTVQTHDPGEPAPPASADAQAKGFSWVDWGAGIYGGWQLVDNAAIALADASPLMLTPGLRCENGKPAPVTDADWIKFTEQLIAVARQTYRVAQTRNQEMVSDATGDLSDACAACHQAYRDVRTPGRAPDPNDPSNKASRCTPRR